MRFGRIALALAAALCFGLPAVDALTPRSGASCSKIGQVIDYQGKRYTCVKSGAKRVWNSGVLIKASPGPSVKMSSAPSPAPTPSKSSSLSASPTSSVRDYTAAQVSTHNSGSSCWSIINGDVYDLTNWISQHPGGAAAIQALCGIDGTQSFNNQHEGSAKVTRQLSQFYIGRLKQ